MRFWNRFLLRLRGGRLEAELNDEIRLHREMLEAEFIHQGMGPREAALAAARRFGNPSAAADWSRDEWTFPRFDALLKDLRFACRLMLRHPLLTGAAILTVAFGVGANTAILSVLDTVLLNPLGMRHTDGVMVARVRIDKLQLRHSTDSAVEFREIQSMQDTFSAAAAMENHAWSYQHGSQATRLLGQAVTPDFFRVFGEDPVIGRFFTAEDGLSVVLSYAVWQAQFGADPSAIGRVMVLDDKPYRIVGVAPVGFPFPADAQAWSPLTLSPERLQQRGMNMNLTVFARLRNGVSAAQAAARVNRYVAGLLASSADLAKVGYGIDLDPFAVYLAGDLRGPLWLLWAAALVVLLTGCANVAGLLLTRSASRRREIAIRLSVGATRWQIVRQLLLESALLGIAGGVAGLAMAKFAVSLLTRVSAPGKQLLAMVSLNGRLLAFGLALALVSGLLFGLVPAFQLLRESQTSAMVRSRRRWFQDAFVTAQVAGAFVLVVTTALLLRSLWTVQQIQPGFDPQHLTTAFFTRPRNDTGFAERLKAALRTSPGVESVAMAYPVPFHGGGLTSGFFIRNRQRQPGEPEWHGEAYFVSPEYLPAMRIPLLRGRNILETDAAGSPAVCLIDGKLAARFFPNQDPIGQEIAMFNDWARVVGVVATVRATTLEDESRPVVYYPLAQAPSFTQWAAVVRSGLPAAIAIREAARQANPLVPVFDIRTMEERIGESLGIRRMLAGLLAIFGGISLLLATIGLYGVIAQVVSERTQEIGIRMTLGARPRQIVLQFALQGLRAGVLGLGLGAMAAVYAQRWLASSLYQARPLDVALFSAVAAGILILLVVSVWWPSRRASRIDPQTALRYE